MVASAVFGRLPWYLVVMLIALASVGAVVVLRLPVLREPAVVTAVDEPRQDSAGCAG